jgi:hypothetical protein
MGLKRHANAGRRTIRHAPRLRALYRTLELPRANPLKDAHAALDTAVLTACGFNADLSDEQILENLLALNLERAAEEAKSAKVKKPKTTREKNTDEMI